MTSDGHGASDPSTRATASPARLLQPPGRAGRGPLLPGPSPASAGAGGVVPSERPSTGSGRSSRVESRDERSESRDDAVHRREFLGLAPRHLLGGIRAALNQTMALALMSIAEHPSTAQQIAVIDLANCLAWGGSACQTCYLRCPLRDEAMVLDDGRPLVMASACNGCGVCVEACRAVNDLGAIRLVLTPVSQKSWRES